jgi:hypothetical protein
MGKVTDSNKDRVILGHFNPVPDYKSPSPQNTMGKLVLNKHSNTARWVGIFLSGSTLNPCVPLPSFIRKVMVAVCLRFHNACKANILVGHKALDDSFLTDRLTSQTSGIK